MKPNKFKQSLLILILVVSPGLVNISSENETVSPPKMASNDNTSQTEASEIVIRKEMARIERSMIGLTQNAISHNYITGSAFAIYHNKNLVIEVNQVFNNSTPLSIASVTKPFTSLAIMQLVDEGLLKLNDPISKYLPERNTHFPSLDGKEITIRNLMQHTSGIPYSGVRQIHIAGSHFMYSNYNYRLLAQIISQVSGLSYAEYMKEKVFTPLEMEDSIISQNSDGASGLLVSTRNLANFANVFLNEGNHKEQSIVQTSKIKKLFKAPEFMSKSETMQYYGLGWRVNKEENKVKLFYHTGLWNGIFADLRILPESKSVIVHLCNPPSYKAQGFTAFQSQMNSLANRYIALMEELPEEISTSEFVSMKILKGIK